MNRLGLPNASQIHSYTTPDELRALFRLACNCPRNSTIIEVGAYLGAATCHLAAGLSQRAGRMSGRIYCVDTWNNETMPEGERDTLREFERNTEPIREMVVPVRKHSMEVTRADIPDRANLVFIDADHSYEATRRDFEHFSAFLADDGVVAFHDCNSHAGVTRVIGEALGGERWIVAGHLANLLWMRHRTLHPVGVG